MVSPATPLPPAPRRPSRFARAFSWFVWLLAAAAVVACFVVRSLDIFDPGVRNLISFSTFGFAVILIWGWFVFLSDSPRRTRYTVFALAIAGVALLMGLLRFEEVSGDMLPKIVFRWTPKADQLLAVPAAPADAEHAETANLVDTSENDYPQFLGPDRRATLPPLDLNTDWIKTRPERLWRQPIGAGWSSYAIIGDYAVTQEQRGDQELVVCYRLKTGEVVWSHADAGRFESLIGGDGPRATPTVVDGKVYTLGAKGLLNCLDGATGKPLWSYNVIEQTGAAQVEWGRSASPLVVDQLVIVPSGGPGKSLMAFDKDSGEIVWAVGNDQVSYSSPMLANFYDVPQVLIVDQDWLVSHRLTDGEELFRHPWPGNSNSDASNSQPQPLPDNRIFLSKGYSVGALLLEVVRDADGKLSTKEIWNNHSLLRTKLTNVVFRDGHVYGLSEGVLECVRLDDGKRKWKRGRYGHGQVVLLGDTLLVTSETGQVALVAASPDSYRELAKFQAIEGKTWNNPALSGALLLVRNHEEAACYALPLQTNESASNHPPEPAGADQEGEGVEVEPEA